MDAVPGLAEMLIKATQLSLGQPALTASTVPVDSKVINGNYCRDGLIALCDKHSIGYPKRPSVEMLKTLLVANGFTFAPGSKKVNS
jgi:hypothetical protein